MSPFAKRLGLRGALLLAGLVCARGETCAFPISRETLSQSFRAGVSKAVRQVTWPFGRLEPNRPFSLWVNFRSAVVRVEINSPKSAFPLSVWVRSHAEAKEIFDEIRWELKTQFDMPLVGLLNLRLNDEFYPVYTVNDSRDRPVLTGNLRVGSGIAGREFYRLDFSFPAQSNGKRTTQRITDLFLARRFHAAQKIFPTPPANHLVAREFPLALHLFQLSRKGSAERINPNDLDRLLYIIPELPQIATPQRPETLRMLHLIRQVDWENKISRRELFQFLDAEEITYGTEFSAVGVPLLAEKLGEIKTALWHHFPHPGQWEDWVRQNIKNSTDRIFTF